MKIFRKPAFIVLTLIALISCERNTETANPFIGKWKIVTPDSDTIAFMNDTHFQRKMDDIQHYFKYSYSGDSITIQYDGPDKIYVLPKTQYFEISHDTLMIDLRKGYYGFETEIYRLCRID